MKCNVCGLNYNMASLGGPGICSVCDCGIPAEVSRLRARVSELEYQLSTEAIRLANEASSRSAQ